MNKIKGLAEKVIKWLRVRSNSVCLGMCATFILAGLVLTGCTLEFGGERYYWNKAKELPLDVSLLPNLDRLSKDPRAQQELAYSLMFSLVEIYEGYVAGFFDIDETEQPYVILFVGFDCFPELADHEVGHYWERIDRKPDGYYAKPFECYGTIWGDHTGDSESSQPLSGEPGKEEIGLGQP